MKRMAESYRSPSAKHVKTSKKVQSQRGKKGNLPHLSVSLKYRGANNEHLFKGFRASKLMSQRKIQGAKKATDIIYENSIKNFRQRYFKKQASKPSIPK